MLEFNYSSTDVLDIGSYPIKVIANFPDGSYDDSLTWTLTVNPAPIYYPPPADPVIVVGVNNTAPYLYHDPVD